MQTSTAPIELLWHRGMLVDIVLDGARTGGAYALLDVRAARGAGATAHVHEREDQTLMVLEGALEVILDDERRVLFAGESIDLPRDVPHAYTARGAGAHFLCVCRPSGFEAFIRATGTAAGAGATAATVPPAETADADDLAALRAAAGLRDLGRRA